MYPELRKRLEKLDQANQCTQSELLQIETIIYCDQKLIMKNLKNVNFSLKIQLSLKLLLSQQYEEINPEHLSIKFQGLSILKNKISSELIEMEISRILDQLEILIYDYNHQTLFFESISKVFAKIIMIPDNFTSEHTQVTIIKRILALSKRRNTLDKIIFMIRENQKKEIIFDEIYLNCHKNEKFLETIELFLSTEKNIENLVEFINYVNRLKKEMKSEKESIELLNHLTNTIQDLILNTENYQIVVVSILTTKIAVPLHGFDCFNSTKYQEMFYAAFQRFLSAKTHIFCDFETLFQCFINEFIKLLKNKEFYAICYYEILVDKPEFFINLRNLLKNQNIIVISTLLEIILTLSQKQIMVSFVQYLSRINNLKISKLDSETLTIFRNLLDEPIIFNILKNFNTSNVNLKNELDIALSTLNIMDLPDRISGMTLLSLHIVLKQLNTDNHEHSLGALFVVLVHELAHYLQRATCSTINEANQPYSPNIVNEKNTKEGGNILEEKLFGYKLIEITLNQAQFILAGGFPTEIDEFQKIFKGLGFSNSSNPSLALQKDCNIIYLGRCGSYFQGSFSQFDRN